MSDRTEIIFGPPGTGKTTRLLRIVEDAIKNGVDPKRIGFFAFTRKAAREAVTRAKTEFSLTDTDLPWFRTLHSAAFRMLGLSSTEVMQPTHYAEFAAALGGNFRFAYSYNENIERVPLGGALGDIALGIYSRARSRLVGIEDEWRETQENDVSSERMNYFARNLDNYKNAYQLLDFSDFLDEVHDTLPLDLMIIDEAQDLTQQQWAFARRIGRDVKRIILAGDDDQAIFQWAGADVQQFLAFSGQRHVLPVSFRLPVQIWRKCQEIVEGISIRQPKVWHPKGKEEGVLEYVSDATNVNLRTDKQFLLLTRLRWQAQIFEQACRDQGVIYQLEGAWSNQTSDVRAVFNYERLRRGEPVQGNRVQQLPAYIPGLKDIPRKSELSWDDIKWPFEGKPDWMTALSGMGSDEREYIRKCRQNSESLVNPGRVVISTIHGIKGGEADHVVLLTDTSKRINQSVDLDRDQELRVWYVGASRAKERLTIASATTRNHVVI